MFSDLDALDDALANAGGSGISKFRPKRSKLQEKKTLKPCTTICNVDARMSNELSSVSRAHSQLLPSQVGARDGVLNHGQIVSSCQSNEENLQGKQMLVSSSIPRDVGAEASLEVENVGGNLLFSHLHGMSPRVDAVIDDISEWPSHGLEMGDDVEPKISNFSKEDSLKSPSFVPDAETEEASNAMGNPVLVSSEGISFDLDVVGIIHADYAADSPETTNLQENEHFMSSSVVCNVDSATHSNQVGNVVRNPIIFHSEDVFSDLDTVNDVLADSVPSGHGTSRSQSIKHLQNKKLVTSQSLATDSKAQNPFPQIEDDKYKYSLPASDMDSELDVPENFVANFASIGKRVSRFKPMPHKLQAKKNLLTPLIDPTTDTRMPSIQADAAREDGSLISLQKRHLMETSVNMCPSFGSSVDVHVLNSFVSDPLLDNQAGQSTAPLQENQIISDAYDVFEEATFLTSPFPQNTCDASLEVDEMDAPTEAGPVSMNDELTEDVDKGGMLPACGLDGDMSIEEKSSRKTRKRKTPVLSCVDETSDGSKDEHTGTAYEASDSAGMEENGSDDEFSEGNIVKRKRMAKGKRQLPAESRPTNRPKSGCKVKANEGPDSIQKKPKKKFSHSTKRTRKLLDETLLATPEDEIDPKKLILKDLILLAEMKEKRVNKAAAARNNSAIPGRDRVAFHAFDGIFQGHTSSQNGDGDEPNPRDEPKRPKINYHSYMKRTPSERWSEANTELFYKAVRQFGTDFEMIRKLFPGRSRHQVKLKYKKEERKHPLQLADALVNRSKDHTHFQLVIDQLQAQAKSISCKGAGSPDINGQTEEDGDQFKDYSHLDSHETHDVDEWSHEVFHDTSPDYVGKDDYGDYYP